MGVTLFDVAGRVSERIHKHFRHPQVLVLDLNGHYPRIFMSAPIALVGGF